MGCNRRINKLAPQGIQTGKSPGLVQTHEARVTDYVGRQNCCEPPLEAFFGHADVLREGPTDMSLWLTWQSVYRGANDRFGSTATERSHRFRVCFDLMCGRLRVGKNFLYVCSIGRCAHVFGLFARFT